MAGAGEGVLGSVSISSAGDTQPPQPSVLSLYNALHVMSHVSLSPGGGDQGDGEAVLPQPQQLRAAVIMTHQHQAAPAQGVIRGQCKEIRTQSMKL